MTWTDYEAENQKLRHEVSLLKQALAHEARVLEAHLEYKSFPKSRRGFAEEQVDRMRHAALGSFHGYVGQAFFSREYDRLVKFGFDEKT